MGAGAPGAAKKQKYGQSPGVLRQGAVWRGFEVFSGFLWIFTGLLVFSANVLRFWDILGHFEGFKNDAKRYQIEVVVYVVAF